MGRPRPPGSHCRFGQGIELVKYLNCRAIRLLCQGDHLPSARLTLGPGSFRDDAMASIKAHLFDEYHSLKSEVLGLKERPFPPRVHSKKRYWAGLTFLSCTQQFYPAHPSTTSDGARRRPTTPNTSLRFRSRGPKHVQNDALRFPTIPFKCATLDAVIRSFGDSSRPRPDRAWQLMQSLAFTFVGPR